MRPTNLVIENHSVSARINHLVATVTVDAEIHNPSRRQVEGTYLFPLPPGAAVSAFDLEIDGKPVAGELLPAGEARSTYEAIVRNAIDPALLEFAGGNLFRARVFPIGAGKTRRISLTYDIVLDGTSDAGKASRGELISCFLLRLEDNMESIGRGINSALQLSKRGGGVALLLTNIREHGAPIKGIENQSSGVIPVMKLLEDSFSYANQLGARQGAGCRLSERASP